MNPVDAREEQAKRELEALRGRHEKVMPRVERLLATQPPVWRQRRRGRGKARR